MLTTADFKLPYTADSGQWAIASDPEDEYQWVSYNEWKCFAIENIEFQCSDYDFGTMVPSIRAESFDKVYYFDVAVEDELNCNQTTEAWRELADGSDDLCVFATEMKGADIGEDVITGQPSSLWYINRIKSSNGYWVVPVFEK